MAASFTDQAEMALPGKKRRRVVPNDKVVPTLGAPDSYTPTMGDGANNFTLGAGRGDYCRVGPMLFVSMFAAWTGKGSATGAIELSIPFTSQSGQDVAVTISDLQGVTPAAGDQIVANLDNANNVIELWNHDRAAGTMTQLVDTDFAATGAVAFSWYYHVA